MNRFRGLSPPHSNARPSGEHPSPMADQPLSLPLHGAVPKVAKRYLEHLPCEITDAISRSRAST